MPSKNIKNEYGEEITISLDGGWITINHSDIKRKMRFRANPFLLAGNRKKAVSALGEAVIPYRVILSSDEITAITDAILQLLGQ